MQPSACLGRRGACIVTHLPPLVSRVLQAEAEGQAGGQAGLAPTALRLLSLLSPALSYESEAGTTLRSMQRAWLAWAALLALAPHAGPHLRGPVKLLHLLGLQVVHDEPFGVLCGWGGCKLGVGLGAQRSSDVRSGEWAAPAGTIAPATRLWAGGPSVSSNSSRGRGRAVGHMCQVYTPSAEPVRGMQPLRTGVRGAPSGARGLPTWPPLDTNTTRAGPALNSAGCSASVSAKQARVLTAKLVSRPLAEGVRSCSIRPALQGGAMRAGVTFILLARALGDAGSNATSRPGPLADQHGVLTVPAATSAQRLPTTRCVR